METVGTKIDYAGEKSAARSVDQRRVMGWFIASAIVYGLFRSSEQISALLQGWYIPKSAHVLYIMSLIIALIADPLILFGGLLLLKFHRAGRWVLTIGSVLMLFAIAIWLFHNMSIPIEERYFSTLSISIRLGLLALGSGALQI